MAKHSTNGVEDPVYVSKIVQDALGPPHDYEPGGHTHPMATDPNCRICGQLKRRHDK